MIDLHCHILHGLDDGPATLDDSLAMCRMAATDGIRTIVAATHFRPGRFESTDKDVSEKLGELRAALEGERIPVELVPAAEVTITPELTSLLDHHGHLFINRNGKYFIAEFGQDMPPRNWNFLLSTLIRSGKIPILTHPERCPIFGEQPELLSDFVDRGGLVQITGMSLTGEAGEEIQNLAEAMLKNNTVHVIATDAHSPAWRPPLLAAAIGRAAMIVGKERAEAMAYATPAAIVAGRNVAVMPRPMQQEELKRKSWLQRLVSS